MRERRDGLRSRAGVSARGPPQGGVENSDGVPPRGDGQRSRGCRAAAPHYNDRGEKIGGA